MEVPVCLESFKKILGGFLTVFAGHLEDSHRGPEKRVEILPVFLPCCWVGELATKQVHPQNAAQPPD